MNYKYHLIGNAHLDPVWQWCVPEGLSLVKSTYRSALDRMKEFPHYKFTSACAGYYKWIKDSEPEMFDEIVERVKEGRWGVTGGMWVQPDCNIPSGEAFCRHFLYSQKFFKENFGFTVKTGYNVDSFGHNGMLPQLFKKSGIDNYVYMRPNREAEKPNLPSENLHIWESPDGSTVNAFRILDGYGDNLTDKRLSKYDEKNQPQMLFYGIGNHGGGPSKVHLEQAEKLIAEDRAMYSTPDDYFDSVDNIEMPVVSEDLQHHAAGCYSANSVVKTANRRAECELVRAEKLDVLANILTKSNLHSNTIENAWERVMFNQFHDILAGCSIKEAYEDAKNAFGYAKETAMEIGTYASERISWRIKTTDFLENGVSEMRDRLWYRDGEGGPMVVFNPHSYPVKTAVSFGMQWISRVVDIEGNDLPYQLVRASYTDGRHVNKCLFNVEIPAYGYRVYFLYKSEDYPEVNFDSDLKISDNCIENSAAKVVFDEKTGAVSSFVFKNREFAKDKLGKVIICDDEKNDTWGHMVTDYNICIGEFGDGKLEIVEKGPIRATIKSTVKYNNSVLVRYYSLYSGSEKLHVRCVLDFDEPYKSAKICFNTNIDNPSVTYSMPYGFIEKATDGQEEPCHTWADIYDENGTGLGLINDCKYSFCAVGNDLRMTAARSCAFLDHFGQEHRDNEMQFLDKGEQEFNYILVPHLEKQNYLLFKEGEILNTPLQIVQETHHDGSLPQKYSAIDVDKENIVVTAVKSAEDGNGLIMRIIETNGEETDCTVDFKAVNAKFTLKFRPQEIKTVKIAADNTVEEILIIE